MRVSGSALVPAPHPLTADGSSVIVRRRRRVR